MPRKTFQKLQNEFKKPGSIYRGAPFWAWNGALDPDELRRQIRLMKQMGLGGFFMHSRVGLATSYLSDDWFACVRACCDEAEKLGMQAWLYDEDRWPSGAAGGLVTKNPKYRMRCLAMEKLSGPQELRWTKDTLAVFAAKVKGSSACEVRRIFKTKQRVRLAPGEALLVFSVRIHKNNSWYNGYTYLDTLSHEAVRQFIKVTHDVYRKRIGNRFGKSVPGIFTDEPNYGHTLSDDWAKSGDVSVPWTAKLPAIFQRRYGYDLLNHLPEIFLDVDSQPFTPARYHYHECTTYLFADAFARQIGEWCGRNRLLSTGHLLAEDTLSSQTSVVGSCLRSYEYMQSPGMDLLTEHWRVFAVAKQVSSAARQFGRKWRLTETYGCTGWDFSLAGHKALGDWQAALGINVRCQHLAWYTMLAEAKRDYPAAISYQSPWWQFYSHVEDYFARIHSIMTRGQEVRDLLVIHPVESMWVKCRADWLKNPAVKEYDRMFWKLSDRLLAGHVDFDYGDEDILSRHGRVGNRQGRPAFVVGRADYRCIMVPPLATIRRSTLMLLKRFRDLGGQVVFIGAAPAYVEAVASDEAKEFASRCQIVPAVGPGVIKAVEKNCRCISITDDAGRELGAVLYLLREDKNAFYLFICNTGQNFADSGRDVSNQSGVRERTLLFPGVVIRGIPGWPHPPLELNPETGETLAADAQQAATGYAIHTSLPALGSRLFLIPKQPMAVRAAARPPLKEMNRSVVDGGESWEARLSESNVLVLDRPRLQIGDGPWQPKNEILRVDRVVRDSLGLPHRGGMMVQPWARQKSRRPKSVPITLSYEFTAQATPKGQVLLALEEPQLFRISLNGEAIAANPECGWWVDRSLRTVLLDPELIRPGRNEVVLECAYNENHPGLEIVYLLGDFGVEVRGIQVSLSAPVRTLRPGDWVEQGLPFYSGNVSYLKKIRPAIGRKERLFVRIPDYRGVAVRILIDGKEAGIRAWEPYEIDITDLARGREEITLTIEVIGHRRNSHGPLHLAEKWPAWTGPAQYVSEGKAWQEEYQLVPCGLMAAPELIVRAPV